MRVIAVVMGEPTSNIRNEEVSSLLDYAYNVYKKDTYLTKDEILKEIEVEKGSVKYANIVVKDEASSVNKKDHKIGEVTYDYDIKKLVAPIKKGDIVGKVTIKENGKNIITSDLTVNETIEKANFLSLYLRYLNDIIACM